MTLRILGIVGSPRKGGNTEILTEHLLNGAEGMGAETELVSLSDLNLNYCRGLPPLFRNRGMRYQR